MMGYTVTGLDRAAFEPLFAMSDEALAAEGAVRITATTKPGAPCRITLEDAEPGESLILINHVSHDVAGPYRATHAIYVREAAGETGVYKNAVPPVFGPRILSLRGFDTAGMMVDALLTQPGEAEAGILTLFANPAITTIHAHYAIRGCFSARIERA
jgi:hypothetical protein